MNKTHSIEAANGVNRPSASDTAIAYLMRARKKSASKVPIQAKKAQVHTEDNSTTEERLFKFSPLSSKKFENDSANGM
jgi:hypothetical protein